KENENLLYDLLLDLSGVDYGDEIPRFGVSYLLHSMRFNDRLRIKIRVAE
ncbi:MAG: NADH-quinone oxidoreductase subunit C, partial [Syntrophobacteraceae bacterium CG23_combo_of_CG06-09_8_20_14_all_50_8]